MGRPSETLQSTIGSIVGAVLIILGMFTDISKFTPEIVGAIVLLLSQIATIVTAVTAARQRRGDVGSGPAGEVTSPN